MIPFPLNKACHLVGDAAELAPYYTKIDAFPDATRGQHPIRRWEYAMALKTIREWGVQTGALADLTQIADIGGGGSNFWQVLTTTQTGSPITVVDPNAPASQALLVVHQRSSVEEWARTGAQYDILTCISVIEHVPDLIPFFKACATLLRPGGLLVCTTDYWDCEGPDVAHFHWMRQRIFNRGSLNKLRTELRERVGFQVFGKANWSEHGAQLYDYSVASLAFIKKEPTA